MHLAPEPAPISLRVHTRVKNDKETGKKRGRLHDQWANFAMVLDCETSVDIRQDLNFLWWRFCELKNGSYVCQQEGLVYADNLSQESVDLIRAFARSKRAEVEDGCPEEIVVESRTQFVDGKFWEALQAGAVIVCFNAPFDLSRLALEYRPAQIKNSGWSMVMWQKQGKPDEHKPKLRIKPKDSRSAFISLASHSSQRSSLPAKFCRFVRFITKLAIPISAQIPLHPKTPSGIQDLTSWRPAFSDAGLKSSRHSR